MIRWRDKHGNIKAWAENLVFALIGLAIIVVYAIMWCCTGCSFLTVDIPSAFGWKPKPPPPDTAELAGWVWALGYPALLMLVAWLRRRGAAAKREAAKIEQCATTLIEAIDAENATDVKRHVEALEDSWIDTKVRELTK